MGAVAISTIVESDPMNRPAEGHLLGSLGSDPTALLIGHPSGIEVGNEQTRPIRR